MLADTLVIFDHAKHQLVVLANAHNQGDPDAAYDDAVARVDALVDALRQPLPDLPEAPAPLGDTLRSNVTRRPATRTRCAPPRNTSPPGMPSRSCCPSG